LLLKRFNYPNRAEYLSKILSLSEQTIAFGNEKKKEKGGKG
jgi:hypothetical protein